MKKKRSTKMIVGVLAVVAVIAIAIVYMLMPKHIETVKSEKRDIASTIKGTGNIEGDSERFIYAAVSGIVDSATLEVGDRVEKDDVVVKFNGEDQKRELNLAKTNLDYSEKMLADAKSNYELQLLVEQNKQLLDTAQKEMDNANSGSKAAVDGIITQKLVDKGSAVEKGQPVYVMQSTEYYRVRVRVSKYDIDKIKVSQKAKVVIGDKEYNGTVDNISQSAVADNTGKPKVYVDVKIDTKDDLLIGLEAEVEISLENVSNAVSVPKTCVNTDDKGSFVYVVENSVLKKAYVETGAEDKEFIQITSGIEEGTSVAKSHDAADYEGKSVR